MPDSARRAEIALHEQLCFALYAASRAVVREYRPLLAQLDLTFPQYLVMLVIWEEGTATVGTLGERLHLDSGTLSPLLKRLESLGLVSRRRRPDDERSVEITATAAGEALREHVARIPPQIADATGMASDEISELRDTLRALTAHLRGT